LPTTSLNRIGERPICRPAAGFGLNVVEALSQRWGVDRDAGPRVWAELAIPRAG
jgi:hypothetical protein